MKLPKALSRVIEEFEKLPGIGPKSAQRLGFYLLHVPQSQLDSFGEALSELKKIPCSVVRVTMLEKKILVGFARMNLVTRK